MQRGCRLSGVKEIRVHDLRHSHASLLIHLGFSPLVISERLGHENVSTTLGIYSHLYPSQQNKIANKLESFAWFWHDFGMVFRAPAVYFSCIRGKKKPESPWYIRTFGKVTIIPIRYITNRAWKHPHTLFVTYSQVHLFIDVCTIFSVSTKI